MTLAVNPAQPTRPSGRATAGKMIAVCAWFGIVAGLMERVLYRWFPATLGPGDLWYAALADLLFFLTIALPLLLLLRWRDRLNLPATALYFSSALLLVDGLSIAFPQPGHAAVLAAAALVAAMVPLAIFLRRPRFVTSCVLRTLPLGAAYALAYLAIIPLWMNYRHPENRNAAMSSAAAPNVLLIIADTLRADHLSAYGYSRPTSPNLAKFAQRGVLFENAVAPSSWTLPSHASMLTGRYPTEHNAGEYAWRLDDRFPTLAAAFEQRGYRTAAFSGNAWLFNRRAGFGRGYMHFEDGSVLERIFQTNLGRRIQNRLMLARVLENPIGRQNAATINRDALRWIQNGRGPFFVTINYFDLHEPFMPPVEYLRRFSRLREPFNQFYWLQDVQLDPQQLKDALDSYDACIAYVDDQVGNLLDRLEQQGLLKNTIVIFTSDHGEEFQEHGFMFHNKGLYWELIHVPLIIYSPAGPAGIRIQLPVAIQDLPATLESMTGAREASAFPGESLAQLWQDGSDQAQKDWPFPISELGQMGDTPLFPSYFGPMKSLVTPQWHYIEGGEKVTELFACCTAAPETADASASESGKLLAAALERAMQNNREVTPEILAAANSSPAEAVRTAAAKSAAQRERMNSMLRSLGYAP